MFLWCEILKIAGPSYRGKLWYKKWPEEPIYSASSFGKMWANIAKDFIIESAHPNTLLFRYEDLILRGNKISELESFFEFQDR